MNSTKMIIGTSIGAIFTGIILAITFYLTEKNSNSSTVLYPASNWARLGLVFGAICELIIGAISGAVIVNFQLGITKAILFGLIFNLLLGGAFYIYTGGGWNDSLTLDFFALIIVGIINAAIVSLVNVGQKSLE